MHLSHEIYYYCDYSAIGAAIRRLRTMYLHFWRVDAVLQGILFWLKKQQEEVPRVNVQRVTTFNVASLFLQLSWIVTQPKQKRHVISRNDDATLCKAGFRASDSEDVGGNAL